MNQINIRKFGLAFGVTGALLHLGCILLMKTVGREGTVKFFNSIIHGMDFSSVVRMDISIGEALIGLTEIFILCWLIGASIAATYNVANKPGK